MFTKGEYLATMSLQAIYGTDVTPENFKLEIIKQGLFY
jgi:hypothetical protein